MKTSQNASTFKNNQTETNNSTSNLAQLVDLPEVFEYLGLSKYTDVFVHQEVSDLEKQIRIGIELTLLSELVA